jgi:hypothetical protein
VPSPLADASPSKPSVDVKDTLIARASLEIKTKIGDQYLEGDCFYGAFFPVGKLYFFKPVSAPEFLCITVLLQTGEM